LTVPPGALHAAVGGDGEQFSISALS
jgi:hypothetical protein